MTDDRHDESISAEGRLSDSWNACAVPCTNCVADGRAGSIDACQRLHGIAPVTSPSATARRQMLNEIVTEGSCPVWLTDDAPTVVLTRATVSSGIRRPVSAPCT